MPFPSKLLNEGEDVVLDLRPHWWFLSGPVASLVGFIILSVVVVSVLDSKATWADAVKLATIVPVVLSVVWFVVRYAKWVTTNFVVTTDRLIYRSGVIAKHGKEIPLARLNDIAFHQSIFERLIGAGDLMIESGGERGQQTFSDIRKPSLVQNVIYREIESGQARDAGRIAGGPAAPLSIPEQIDKLDDLRRRGVISQAEFDAKKTKLLDQL